MPNQQVTITAATGLSVQSNSFTVPDGSFEQAENVVFSKDNIISKRRGFNTLTPALSMTSPTGLVDYLGFLFVTQNGLLSKIDTTTGALTSLTGDVVINAGAKPRYTKANGNLYIATANGIRKVESSTASVLQAGIPRGLDLDISISSATKTGILAPNAGVGYRILFGRLDANGNKVVGAPSELTTKTNNFINGSTQAAASSAGTTITVTSTAHGLIAGDLIVVANSDGTNPPNGTWSVATAAANTFTFTATSAPASLTKLDFGVFRTPVLEFTIPTELSTQYFYQVYRTTQTTSVISTVSDDGQLIYEANISNTDVSNKAVTFTDTINELFKDAFLYTNPNEQGFGRANFRPPFASDITSFANSIFLANTQNNQSLSLSLTSVVSTVLAAGDYVEIKLGATTHRYIATTSAPTSGFTGVSTSGTWNYGYANASGYFYFQLTNSTSTTVSPAITSTAKSLCKALNRNPASLVFGYYLSGADSVPGQFFIEARSLSASSFSLIANTSTSGSAFSPVLPSSFASGTQVTSSNSVQQNAVFFSKQNEPEAFPLSYNLLIGAKTSAILRIVALRDAMLVIKTDGLFVIRGDSPSSFVVQALDSTIQCVAADSVTILNNSVFMLSNQGVVSVSDSGANVVSRNIEPLLTSIIGKSAIATETNAVAYESERLYLLSTLSPNSSIADVVYCFNSVTNAWSTWTNTFSDALVNPTDDKLYMLTTGGTIGKERKLQNRLDYTELSYSGTSGAVIGTNLSELSFLTGTIEVNDSIYDPNALTINRIVSIDTSSGTPVYTFKNPLSWSAMGALELYKPIRSVLKTAPLTLGDVSKWKQFSEFTVTFRNRSASSLTLSFANDSVLSSVETQWSQDVSTQSGWGFNWGSLWGGENIDSVLTTQGSQACRTYIPLDASRGTFIQASIVHAVAAESMDIQSLSYSARAYSSRTTK